VNISPPIALRFEQLKPYQISNARRGICPHCTTVSLVHKHTAEEVRFLECSICTVVVALDRGSG
jgi:formate dehydrogenase maturation protein FdhE